MRNRYVQAAALVVMTLLVYLPTTRSGYIWDDDYYVTRNFALRSGQGLIDLWARPGVVPQYYPVTHTGFWIEYHLWGLRPAGYHFVNILLHATSAVLLWILLTRLQVPGAWLAAAVFALHPVHVESVAWITERKNVLSGAFYLAALLAYLPLALRAEDAPRRAWWSRYAATLVLFVLALLSKSVTASFPAAILLIVWWKRGRLDTRDLIPLLPMFALGLLMSWATATMERNVVGAGMFGPEWNFSWADRVLIAGRAVWFYAYKLVWPAKLIFVYPRWKIDSHQLWQWVLPVGAAGLVALAGALRGRIGRGTVVALLLFGGTLVPALGFVNVYPMRFSFVADHFQYLASIALIALIVAAAATRVRRGLPFAGTVVLLLLGVLTWRRQSAFTDLRSLWADTIDKNPDAWMARNNYARLLIEEKKYPEAEKQLHEALKTDENNPDVLTQLGLVFQLTGREDEAIEVYTTVTQTAQNDWLAHYRLGKMLAERGKIPAALFHLNHSIDESPNYAPSHEELARVLAATGQTDQAIMQLEQAVALDPDLLSAQNALVMGLLSSGRVDQAEARLREILRRYPDSAAAHNNLGIVLERRGDAAGAIGEYERALKSDPDYAEAKQNLARLQRTPP